jgi:hypothetical protein
MAVDDPSDDVSEVSLWADADKLAGLDQRRDDRPVLAAAVRPGEESILPIERNLALILPISGRMSSFTIAGIRCTGKVRVAFRSSDARAVSSCTSR